MLRRRPTSPAVASASTSILPAIHSSPSARPWRRPSPQPG
jgi:hypothetical protein